MKITIKKSKGFTLVELLIVVVIIGILAGVMMLSVGSITDKAEAVKILSDLRAIRSAGIMYYVEEGTTPPNVTYNLDLHANDATYARPINKYLGVIPADGYWIAIIANGPSSVGYQGPKLTQGVGAQLKAMKDKVGLYNGAPTSAVLITGPNYNGGPKVYMVIPK